MAGDKRKKKAKVKEPKPWLDESHPENVKVLYALKEAATSLRERVGSLIHKKKPGTFATWDSIKNPYMNSGIHPDVVDRIWDQLGFPLPQDCRCLLFGTPALVHPKTGVIIAACYRGECCLRLPKSAAPGARRQVVRQLSSGIELNIQTELGEQWVFTAWGPGEIDAIQETYQELSA